MRQNVLLGLLILVAGLGIFSIVYAVMNPEENVVSYISGLTTVVIAILTMGYVYVTSGQLNVMGKQLEQMEAGQKFENQPLPYINDIDVWIDKPSFFFTPSQKGEAYNAQSRYWARIKIRNVGSHPAVCIDVSGRIMVRGGGRERNFSATSINIPTLGEKEDYPAKEEGGDKFLFAEDGEGLLIQALREENPDLFPLLGFRILFRNILGGCFLLTCGYRLYPGKREDDSLFVEWLSGMNSFWIKYKNDVANLRSLEDSTSEKWNEEFGKLRKSFEESMSGKDIRLVPWLVPGSFAIMSIGIEEYKKEIAEIAYEVKLSDSGLWAMPKSAMK